MENLEVKMFLLNVMLVIAAVGSFSLFKTFCGAMGDRYRIWELREQARKELSELASLTRNLSSYRVEEATKAIESAGGAIEIQRRYENVLANWKTLYERLNAAEAEIKVLKDHLQTPLNK